MTPPERSACSHSFARAARSRLTRLETLRGVREGTLDPIPLIQDTPNELRSLFVFDFLREIPRVGPSKIRELNRRAVLAQINLATTLGELQDAKREWLVGQLDRRERTRRHPNLSRRPQG